MARAAAFFVSRVGAHPASRSDRTSASVGHQGVRRDNAQLAGLVVLDRLLQLLDGVHDERTVVSDRLANRPAAEQQHLERRPVGVLRGVGGNGDAVAWAEHSQLAGADGAAGRADGALAAQHVDQRVEVGPPRHRQSRAGGDRRVRVSDRGVCAPWAVELPDVAGDDANQRPAVVRGDQLGLLALNALVSRRRELVLGRQVHPELDAVEQAARYDELLGWGLDVQDAGAGCHPLGGAVLDHPAATVGILVLEGPIDHVGHGLEAAVWVPCRALWLARCVVDLAHLVHVHEWVEVGGGDAGERADHREAFALEATRASGDRLDRTLGVAELRGRQARQGQCVGAYGGHRMLQKLLPMQPFGVVNPQGCRSIPDRSQYEPPAGVHLCCDRQQLGDQPAKRSQRAPNGGTRSRTEAGSPWAGSSTAFTPPKFPTPEPKYESASVLITSSQRPVRGNPNRYCSWGIAAKFATQATTDPSEP